MDDIIVARRGDPALDYATLCAMFRLRHQVFHDRLGWDVVSDAGLEHDRFDIADPVYVLARGRQELHGCWRLLPTDGPNMLRDVFPQLMGDAAMPADPRTWELSRFAVLEGSTDSCGFGLSAVPVRMLDAAVRYAQANGITRYVSVTSVAIERMFRKLGIAVERLGPALRIGRVLTVACAMPVDGATAQAVRLAALGPAPSQAA
jgi:acyl homoserine lactone synthase